MGNAFDGRMPAFLFYPSDWLMSMSVQAMSLEQQGAYIRLLSYAWLEDGLPHDISLIRHLLLIPYDTKREEEMDEEELACSYGQQFEILWERVVKRHFKPDGQGRLRNARQEAERKKALDARQAKVDAGKKGGESTAQALLQHRLSSAAANGQHRPSITSPSPISSPSPNPTPSAEGAEESAERRPPSAGSSASSLLFPGQPPAEKKTRAKRTEPPPIPAVLDTPAFREALDKYERSRKSGPHKPVGLEALYAKLAPHGVEIAIAALDDSRAAGWLYVAPEKVNREKLGPRPDSGKQAAIAKDMTERERENRQFIMGKIKSVGVDGLSEQEHGLAVVLGLLKPKETKL